MFDKDFFPTPENVIFEMLQGVEIENKTILEPSAGKGDIIDYCNENGAKEVLFCELNDDLQQITKHKARFLTADFLELDPAQISHIDLIIMNPPFSADEKHILHAFNIAPAGCKIIALANSQTLKNTYTSVRKELKNIVEAYGSAKSLGAAFINAERSTAAEIELIKIQKPGGDYSQEFEGFFMDDQPEAEGVGIMPFNVVRDLVNRYTAALKIFDKQLEEAEKMQSLTAGYFSVKIGLSFTNNDKPVKRLEFKKEMQKSGWNYIFKKLDMQKYTTAGLRDDINKFVETQHEIPFTMQNIYKMLEIVVGTTGQRMDKAILEAFDKVTKHYHENRYNVEGWKTNSHYLLNRRFIMPGMIETRFGGGMQSRYDGNAEKIEDLVKALCFMTGRDYGKEIALYNYTRYKFRLKDAEGNYIFAGEYNYPVVSDRLEEINREAAKYPGSVVDDQQLKFGEWFEWSFFKIRGYKKGTMHIEFKSVELWEKFNQHVAKLKGYPLYEKAYRKPEKEKSGPTRPEAKKRPENAQKTASDYQPVILGTFKLKK